MLLLLISFFINTASANTPVELQRSMREGSILNALIKTTTPKIPQKECFKDIPNLLIGNDLNGYQSISPDKNGCFNFIPISYKNEMNFKFNGKVILQKKYRNPIPKYYIEKNSLKTKTPFSSLYTILSAKEDSGNGQISLYIYIVNNWGELIWIHTPKNSNFNKVQYITTQYKNGYLYTLYKGDESHFQKIDFKGNIIFSLNNFNFAPKAKFHHDFILKENKVFFLIQKKSFVRKKFWTKPSSYLYDELIQVNLKSKKYKTLWSSLNYFNLLIPNKTRKKRDFTHSNSLSMNKKGEILISIRNQNTIIKLDYKWMSDIS